ncbi:low-density lipoprotein receptor domain class A domain-containing protein [Ditylenchus destructor]|uniref:Low-density lipoprotein receptor domain class A domain-containing protein n=1 Tax=Ditylenchus destructor TaxID=166010 RepID=A0AAD4NDA8_9BILA|nr:low-density lipoprotein receptor domain class A domain-containing protein [Ditylenchus destructor]
MGVDLGAYRTILTTVIVIFSIKFALVDAFSIRDVITVKSSGKRTAATENEIVICPTWHPFQCPNGDCIPIKYLCDGSPDCTDEYDENKSMCTAAVRPPVEETVSFIRALLHAHGNDFLVKVFGPKAQNQLEGLGGIEKVAVAISQSPTIDAFGAEVRLTPEEIQRMADVLEAIMSGLSSELSPDEASDFRFFVQKLQETGFF